MAENQPNPDDKDKFVNGIPMDEDDTKSSDDTKAEDEAKVKADEEAKAKADADAKAQAEADKAKEDEAKAKEDVGRKDDDTTTHRPEKYIPIAQYTSEKKGWRETEDGYKKRIEELETIKGSDEGSKKADEAIKAYAEKYNVDPDSVKELAKILGSKTEEAPKTTAKAVELTEEQQASLDEAQQIKAEKLYDVEFTDVATPALKKAYPTATPEQLATAKKDLEVLATTRAYLDKPLDYIVWKENESMAKIFATKPTRKGVESGRPAAPQKGTDMSAEDFKDTSDFSSLFELPLGERDVIIKKFDNPTWTRLKNWMKANEDLTVS